MLAKKGISQSVKAKKGVRLGKMLCKEVCFKV